MLWVDLEGHEPGPVWGSQMNWYSTALAPYHLRTIRIGINITIASLAVLIIYPLLPNPGEVHPLPYVAFIGSVAVGVVIVACLPWVRLFRSRLGVWSLYAWCFFDIVLITLAVAATGSGESELFVLYTLTSVFFAASYPPRGQLALLLMTIGCYLVPSNSWADKPGRRSCLSVSPCLAVSRI
jgi:hypothetical protein